MNAAALRNLIAKSILLSDGERAYWTENLPKMTPEQMAKLGEILTQAEDIRWNDRIAHYVSLIGNAAKSL